MTGNGAADHRAPPPSAVPLAVFLAAVGCCTVLPASADDDKRPAEVTITVVQDPEQLKEKINKIQLPEANEDTRPAQKTSKQPASDKSPSSTGGQQRNETTEHHRDAGGPQEKENAEKQRAASSEQREQSTAGHHDASDKPTTPGKVEDESRHGESKLPR